MYFRYKICCSLKLLKGQRIVVTFQPGYHFVQNHVPYNKNLFSLYPMHVQMSGSYIQYSSHQSWHLCAVNTCVFFNFCCDSSQNMPMTRNGLHVSQLFCNAHKPFFVCCMPVVICVLHDSKKHVSNALCDTCESVF